MYSTRYLKEMLNCFCIVFNSIVYVKTILYLTQTIDKLVIAWFSIDALCEVEIQLYRS